MSLIQHRHPGTEPEAGSLPCRHSHKIQPVLASLPTSWAQALAVMVSMHLNSEVVRLLVLKLFWAPDSMPSLVPLCAVAALPQPCSIFFPSFNSWLPQPLCVILPAAACDWHRRSRSTVYDSQP